MEIPNIKFGTDGWRGLIADDFTYDNAALVSCAIQRYLTESGAAAGPVLIGYDNRFSAEHYAAHIGAALSELGMQVVLCRSVTPTPAVACGVLELRASCAIMLTASHNPYLYQGLKFIPEFAGPAMPEATDRITALIAEMAADFVPPRLCMQWTGETIDLHDSYFRRLDNLVDLEALRSAAIGGAPLRVFYTAMHGAGAGWFDAYLRRAGVAVESCATLRDVYFGGSLPDPSEANLARLHSAAAGAGCNVILGTDGDADRFGLLDLAGDYFGANQALPMLGDYLIRHRGCSGTLVRTVATSHLVDAVAAEHGLPLIETAVGFKYVGAELRKGALIGGEESGGISIKGHVPEKDGLLACLLMLELAAKSGKDWQQNLTALSERVGRYAYRRLDEHTQERDKLAILTALEQFDAGSFAGREIRSVNRTDGTKFEFSDGSWMLVRGSGTEPLLRIYVEVREPERLDATCTELRTAVLALAATQPA